MCKIAQKDQLYRVFLLLSVISGKFLRIKKAVFSRLKSIFCTSLYNARGAATGEDGRGRQDR